MRWTAVLVLVACGSESRPAPPPPPPPNQPLAAPREGSQRVTVTAVDAPSFGAALVIDLEPPFVTVAELEDRGTPAAAVIFHDDTKHILRVFRPGLVDSADDVLKSARLAKAKARRTGDCVVTDNPEIASLVSLDCFARSPAGPVACAWQGPRDRLDVSLRSCQSLTFE